jgi:hypothetical protein
VVLRAKRNNEEFLMKKIAFKVSEERVDFDEMFFETLTFANLPETVTVEAANIGVRLKCETPQQVHLIKERYKDFLLPNSNPSRSYGRIPSFEVGVWVKERPFFITPPSTPEEFIIEVIHENNRIILLSYSFAGYFDVQSYQPLSPALIAPSFRAGEGAIRRGKLVIVSEADEYGFLGSIENYLRVAYSWLCIERNGFLLHACGIIRKGKAYVFFGPSESGKTTVAMLSRKWTILSDDLVIVLRINNQTRAFGVPFRGEAPFPFVSKNENAPIAGFFELHKSSFFRLEKLSRPLALAKLVSNIPFLSGNLIIYEKMISVCNDVISDIPCYTMYFTKDCSFWQELVKSTSPPDSPFHSESEGVSCRKER